MWTLNSLHNVRRADGHFALFMRWPSSSEGFAFDRPNEWADCKQRFQRFRMATKLSKEDREVQVSLLIYAMGSEAENIFKSFTFADRADMKKFDEVLGKKKRDPRARLFFIRECSGPGKRLKCL